MLDERSSEGKGIRLARLAGCVATPPVITPGSIPTRIPSSIKMRRELPPINRWRLRGRVARRRAGNPCYASSNLAAASIPYLARRPSAVDCDDGIIISQNCTPNNSTLYLSSPVPAMPSAIRLFRTAEGLKHHPRRAEIGAGSPVFGLRPRRSPLSRNVNVPNPEIFTASQLPAGRRSRR